MIDKHITTATELNDRPQPIFRAADKGKLVVIFHDRYPDRVFELRARDKNPLAEATDDQT